MEWNSRHLDSNAGLKCFKGHRLFTAQILLQSLPPLPLSPSLHPSYLSSTFGDIELSPGTVEKGTILHNEKRSNVPPHGTMHRGGFSPLPDHMGPHEAVSILTSSSQLVHLE